MSGTKEKLSKRPVLKTLVRLFLGAAIVSVLIFGVSQLKPSAIAGAYAGEQLSLYIAPIEPDSEELTGWLALKGYTYPLTARVTGKSEVTGHYYANGGTFPIKIKKEFGSDFVITIARRQGDGTYFHKDIPITKYGHDLRMDGEWTGSTGKVFFETQENGTVHVLLKLNSPNGETVTTEHPNYIPPQKFMLTLNRFGNIFQGSATDGKNSFPVEGHVNIYDQHFFLTLDGKIHRFSYGEEAESDFLDFAGTYREDGSDARLTLTYIREFEDGKRTGHVLADGNCYIPEWGRGIILDCTPEGENLNISLRFDKEPYYMTITLVPKETGFEISYSRYQGTALGGYSDDKRTRKFTKI